MSVRVVNQPSPIALPEEIAGGTAGDAALAAVIAAVQRTIDGPSGWLCRSLGMQTLELILPCFPARDECSWDITLPCPPVVANSVSVKYLDAEEVEQTVDPATYRIVDNQIDFRRSFAFPKTARVLDAVRIRYQAGYEADDIPPQAKQAVILMAQQMRSIGAENLFLRQEEVDGVGNFQYTVSDQAGEVIRKATENLLQGLRLYA